MGKWIGSRIIRIPERWFLHGACLFKDRVASFFYFEDIDSGMAPFLSMSQPGRTEMARFSPRISEYSVSGRRWRTIERADISKNPLSRACNAPVTRL